MDQAKKLGRGIKVLFTPFGTLYTLKPYNPLYQSNLSSFHRYYGGFEIVISTLQLSLTDGTPIKGLNDCILVYCEVFLCTMYHYLI